MGHWLGKIFARQSAAPPPGNQFYVDPAGGATNPGAIGSPWTLPVALAGGYPTNTVQPGDTIFLRGGTYTGLFTNSLNGAFLNPITVRHYPGERPIIDCNNGTDPGAIGYALYLQDGVCSYTNFIGLEITNSLTNRWNATSGSNPADARNRGVFCNATEQNVINCFVHDTGQGIESWQKAHNSILYGNIICWNGWNAPDREHGHGTYINNFEGGSSKTIKHNIYTDVLPVSGSSECQNIQAYGSSGSGFNNSLVTENILANGEVIIGGAAGFDMAGTSATNNISLGGFVFGYHGLYNNPTWVTGNSFVNLGASSCFAAPYDTTTGRVGYTMTGNLLVGDLDGFSSSDYPTNTYYAKASPPASPNQVYVFPNQYEANRAYIAIHNWQGLSSVAVDLSSAVANGTAINIWNAQDYLGTLVYSGTYGGGTVSIPMTGMTVGTPVGLGVPGNYQVAVTSTGPEFGEFIVRQQGA